LHRTRYALLLLLVALLSAALYFSNALLATDDTQPCDAALVLAGEEELRVTHGIDLVEHGTAHRIVLDVQDELSYGVRNVDLARNFLLTRLPPSQSSICTFRGDSTLIEAHAARECLRQTAGVHKVLLVTHDFHSRRALMTFRQAAPEYEFHVSSVRDPYLYRPHWWHTRENTKYFVISMTKMLWYLLVERWAVQLHLM